MYFDFIRSMALLFAINSLVSAADWPQFLGPQRNGISTETGLIDQFSQDGPKVVWRSRLGVGMSGIAVVGETAFTMFQDTENQYLVSFNTKNGEPRWKTAVAPAYTNAMGNGPRATPVVNSGEIYSMTGEGILVCLSSETGKKKWSFDPVKNFGGKPAEYGMACSPVLTRDLAILTVGLPQATVIAVKRSNGETAWTAGEGNAAGYSSPALLSLNNQTQLVSFHGRGVLGIEPKTGQELWSYPYITDYDCNIATPISVGNNVLISAGENHGTTLLKVPTTSGGTVDTIWTSLGNRSVLRNEWQTSILLNGYLYGFDNIGSAGPVTNLTCIEAKTGERLWQKKRFGKGNLIAADGKLWCSTMKGELVIVAASPDRFHELDRTTVIGETRQAPALSDGKIFLRDGAEIVCIDVKK